MTGTNLPDGRSWRTWGFRIGLLLLLAVGLGWGGYLLWPLLAPHKADDDLTPATAPTGTGITDELADAVAETDRLDPFWRVEEIEARRSKLPAEENSALLVLEAHGLIPQKWPDLELYTLPQKVPPPRRLTEQQRTMAEEQMRPAQPALHVARQLLRRPHGHYPVEIHPDKALPSLQHNTAVRKVKDLLWLDTFHRAATGDLQGAVSSWHSLLNAVRSQGDEPIASIFLLRQAGAARVLSALEILLAQGELNAGDLLRMQQALEGEVNYPALRFALRIARAEMHHNMCLIGSEKTRWDEMAKLLQNDTNFSGEQLKQSLPTSHAWLLRHFNEAMKLAELPPHEHLPRLQALQETTKTAPALVQVLHGAVHGRARWCQLHLARLRCGAVALAVERYRVACGQWPLSLRALVPTYLREVPPDPYDGKPLRYVRRVGEVLVYSIGRNGVDDEGNCPQGAQNSNDPDLGFRLWDVAGRRVPVQ